MTWGIRPPARAGDLKFISLTHVGDTKEAANESDGQYLMSDISVIKQIIMSIKVQQIGPDMNLKLLRIRNRDNGVHYK